jgi:hypothetical protein
MTNAERMCEAAIAYADLGFFVLPLWSAHDGRCDCGKVDCDSPGKHPHGRYAPHGLKDATRDKAVICSWFSDGQLVNIGIRTGPESGILVLDVDPRHGGDESLKGLGTLPDTATVETGGGGWHRYFKYPAGLNIRNSAGKLGPGLDIRGAGGYVVAPPSIHVSGRVYTWLRDPRGGLADLPQHILTKLSEKPALTKAIASINGLIPKGQRDDTLTSMAGAMRRRGMTEGAILAALREENRRCEKPLPDTDLQRIARSIGRKEPGQLISRPKSEPVHVEPAVPFPVDALPQPVARFVDGAAHAIGCDTSFVAVPLLVGLAAAIGNTRRIELKRGWTEPAVMWGALVADSGTLKSPAMEVSLRPVYKRQHAAMKRYAEAMDRYRTEFALYEKELAAWKKSGKDKGNPPIMPEEPYPEEIWASDATTEAVAAMLVNNPRGLLVASDELAAWLGGFDRYAQGKGGDAAHWLQMHGGRSLKINRKTGNPRILYVPRAAVSIVGGIPPGVLRRALGTRHRENGLAARLLLACPPRQAKHWTETDIGPRCEGEVEVIFERLYSLKFGSGPDGEPCPVIVPLSADGKAAWVDFYNEHAQEQAELTGDLAATWSKLEGYAGRLALVIHFIRWAANDAGLVTMNAIDATDIQAGVSLSRWFGNEARRVYAILNESDEERDRRRLIELIQRKGGSVTIRDLMRSARMFPSADVAERALDELVRAEYGHWDDPPIGPAGGHPTRCFVLDPGVDADTTLDSSTVSGVVSVSTASTRTDCSDEQEERAAIQEYDGSLPRDVAEERAFGSEEGA